MQTQNSNETNENENVETEQVEVPETLQHIHPDLLDIFGYEESRAGFIKRAADGNLRLDSDLFFLDPNAADPEWSDHSFGLLKLRKDSVRWDPNHEEYVLDVVPAKPRYVMVPARDNETGEIKLVRRKESTLTVVATQVVPQPIGEPRTQVDSWAKGLMRDRQKEEERKARKAKRQSQRGKGGRKKVQRLMSASVSGDLVAETSGSEISIFRIGHSEPEITFNKNPEGYAAKNAYMEKYANETPSDEELGSFLDELDDAAY